MKSIVYFLLLFLPIFSISQIEDPVIWSFDVEDLGKGEYKLIVDVEIEKGWHIYSQHKDPESFIVATSFYFKKSREFFLISGRY